MIPLAILSAAVVLIAAGLTARHYAGQIIAEIHAAEQRQIAREHAAGIQAGFDAGWHGGRS